MIYLILFFGFVLRLISINQSLWLDEATSALAAKMPLSEIFTKFLPGDFHPPLYYLVLKFWSSIFGYSEISLRFPSLIFGTFTIYLVYLIGKELFDKKIGLTAAVLIATSGLHIYYSQEARMYALAAFLITFSTLFFVKTIKSGRVGDFVIWAVLFALSVLADYLPILMLPAFWVSGVVMKKDSYWWKKFLTSHIILVLIGLVWLPQFLIQITSGLKVEALSPAWWQILGQSTPKNIALIPVKFMIGRIGFDDKILYGIIVGVIGIIFGYLMFKARNSKILWAWLLTPVVLAVIIGFKIPIVSYFRMLFVLPAFYLLIASGITPLKGHWVNIALGFVLIVNLVSSSSYLTIKRYQREDWRSTAIALGEERVIFPSSSQKEALIYYKKENQIISLSQLKAKENRVWLSRYVWEISDPADVTRINLENLGYNKASEHNFNGVVFWKYVKNEGKSN